MNIKKKNIKEIKDMALQQDLERRFGPALAQAIMDQIKKAEALQAGNTAPDYMAVKMMSEAAETYRRDTMGIIKKMKACTRAYYADSSVVDLECFVMKKSTTEYFEFYRRLHKAYFILFRRAMDAYASVSTYSYASATLRQAA